MADGNRCYLAVEEKVTVASVLRAFPEEFAEHLEQGRCPRPRPIILPKLVDLANGRAVYDERQYLKQPDWTYADEPASSGTPGAAAYDATAEGLDRRP